MRICGVGDNVVDRYFNQRLMFPGGNAVNFAVHARRSGAEAAYLGVIGTDAEGDLIRSSLDAEGIELDRLRVKEGPSAFATVHMDDKGNDRISGPLREGRVHVHAGRRRSRLPDWLRPRAHRRDRAA